MVGNGASVELNLMRADHEGICVWGVRLLRSPWSPTARLTGREEDAWVQVTESQQSVEHPWFLACRSGWVRARQRLPKEPQHPPTLTD
jgi:hypothetical protein